MCRPGAESRHDPPDEYACILGHADLNSETLNFHGGFTYGPARH